MKMKVWTILAALISTSAFADQSAMTPATISAPTPDLSATPAPAPANETALPKPAKKKNAKAPARKAAPVKELETVPLVPGLAVVEANHVNVRGRAGLIGEVIGKLTNGQPVTVIEEVTLKNSKADEPSAWAKINLPESVNVWVNSTFVDRASMTVKATKLNLRGGPGENYSVLGLLHKGDAVRELQNKGDWMEIEAPASAFAFVAAQYLKQGSPEIVSNPVTQPEPTPEPAPTITTTVAETPTVTPATEPSPTTEVAVAPTTPTPEMTTIPETPAELEPLPPRIVSREGLVRSTLSVQAPTKFELVSPDNFRPINFLFTTSTNLDLRRYKGMHIIVTGEEGLDERWKNTPVITIQSIHVIE